MFTDVERLGTPLSVAEMVREKEGWLSLSRVVEREITPVWLSMVKVGSSWETEWHGGGENHTHFYPRINRMKYCVYFFQTIIYFAYKASQPHTC